MSFNFLKNLKVEANKVEEKRDTTKKERNPVLADLRVFKNGAVYPSAALVAKFNLEYTGRTVDANGKFLKQDNPGNGFDVIDSRFFGMGEASFLMIAAVPKDAGKVDLFQQCAYDKNNQPIGSVLDQGSTSFGKELLPLLKEMYGAEPNEQGYIDLVMTKDENLDAALAVRNNIYFVPKTVVRGTKQGERTYERRENLNIFVLTPAGFMDAVEDSTEADIEEQIQDAVTA